MTKPPTQIEIPAHIWAVITQKFPWAEEDPQGSMIFLSGIAIGVWLERERVHEKRDVTP